MCFQHVYRASILSENMVYDLVRTLKIEHVELEKNAASAVFQASPWGLNICFWLPTGCSQPILQKVYTVYLMWDQEWNFAFCYEFISGYGSAKIIKIGQDLQSYCKKFTFGLFLDCFEYVQNRCITSL